MKCDKLADAISKVDHFIKNPHSLGLSLEGKMGEKKKEKKKVSL